MAEITAHPDTTLAPTPTLFKKRTNKSTQRKRPATPPPDDNPSDSSSLSSSEDESGRRLKRRKTGGVAVGSSAQQQPQQQQQKPLEEAEGTSKSTSYAADKTSALHGSNDATKHSNWYEEANGSNNPHADKPPGSTKTKRGNQEKDTPTTTNTNADATYKGTSSYQSFIAKNPNAPSKTLGPTKAPASNVRTVTTMDFAPDVCKDYKKTGFCGFGDSCKYLHTREVYKQGWELDKDWESVSKKDKTGKTVASAANRAKAEDQTEEEADNELLEKIPFACVICEGPYKFPVQTRCGHYFCERCALERFKKNPACAVCGQGTNGVFNGAKQLKRLLERKRERARRRKEAARERGEDVSDDDDDDGA
ncbi:MAG: RNA-splicing factor [Alyxoria varia]|nr:MAG: RNA-splicing factor [Alyxoria varia]